MMSDAQSPAAERLMQCERLTAAQQRTLKRAVAKVVFLGSQVGVSIDEMITLLGSGLTVGELLDYLAQRQTDSL